MTDLYYWPTPNGWKVSIMLEEQEVVLKIAGRRVDAANCGRRATHGN
jgi:glutathione S-transferase